MSAGLTFKNVCCKMNSDVNLSIKKDIDEICENYSLIQSDVLSGISNKGGDKSIISLSVIQELKLLKSKRRLRLLIKRRSST